MGARTLPSDEGILYEAYRQLAGHGARDAVLSLSRSFPELSQDAAATAIDRAVELKRQADSLARELEAAAVQALRQKVPGFGEATYRRELSSWGWKMSTDR